MVEVKIGSPLGFEHKPRKKCYRKPTIDAVTPEIDRFFSPREMDVMRELVRDAPSNKEIACRLGLATGTVKVYVSHLMTKLGLGSRMEIMAYALRSGNFRSEVPGYVDFDALPE